MSPPAGHTVVLLRHGESEANAAGRLAGWADSALTPRGIAQARAAGAMLADIPLRTAVTSTLQRAWQTAELALAVWEAHRGVNAPPIVRHDDLRERGLGDWCGAERAALGQEGLRSLLSWEDCPPGGGESQRQLMLRVLPLLARLEQEWDSPALVVCHGGVIRCLLGLLDGVDRPAIGHIRVDNAEPLVREVPAGTWARLWDEVEAERSV